MSAGDADYDWRRLPPATRPYAEVIGDPIAQSKSPAIHNFWLGKLGIDAEYRAAHVKPEELAEYLAARRADPLWRGCNVTIPHKQAIIPLLDEVAPRAAGIGAVNTVWPDGERQLCGTNTDIDGVAEALRGLDLAGRRVAVIGSGGASRSVFADLAELDQASVLNELDRASVRVLARSREKALVALSDCGLLAETVPFEPGTGALAGAALIINATQLGMRGQQEIPQFVLDELADTAPDCRVFDMVYDPLETALLTAAHLMGRETVGGLTMLVGQARPAFSRFFGEPAPRLYDAELRRILTA